MNQVSVKKHFFVVEDKSTQQKFRVKLKQIDQDNWTSFEMQVIEGKSFFVGEGEEDYLRLLLSEIALSYSGIGSMNTALSNENFVFHFDIAR